MKTESWMIIADLIQKTRETEERLSERIYNMCTELMAEKERQQEIKILSNVLFDISEFSLVLINHGELSHKDINTPSKEE